MLWLAAIPGKLWGWIGGAIAIVGALAVGWAKAKQEGIDRQVAAQTAKEREAANVRVEEDNRAARVADPAAELHDKWGR